MHHGNKDEDKHLLRIKVSKEKPVAKVSKGTVGEDEEEGLGCVIHYSRMENKGKIHLSQGRSPGGQTGSGVAGMESRAAHGRLDFRE